MPLPCVSEEVGVVHNVIQLSIRACKVDRNRGADEARSKARPGAQEHHGGVHRGQEAVRAILQGRAEDHRDAAGGSGGWQADREPVIVLAAGDVRLRQVLLPDAGRHRPLPHQLPRRAGADPAAVHLLPRRRQPRLRPRGGLLAGHRGLVDGPRRAPRRRRRADEPPRDAQGPSRRVRAQAVAARLRGRADAMASLSSLNFAAGVEAHGMSEAAGVAAPLSRRLSSSRVGFEDSLVGQMMMASHGGNAALRCRGTSSLAAIMAQMLSYRTTHIWVTHGEDDVLVGVVGYMEIFNAVTRDVVAPPA